MHMHTGNDHYALAPRVRPIGHFTCHFKVNNERDVNGFFGTRWMSLADLYNQLKDEAEDALLAFDRTPTRAKTA